MKKLRHLTVCLMVLISFCSQNSFGQYKNASIVENNPLDRMNGKHPNLVSAKIAFSDQKTYLKWVVVNDSIQGVFIIYKGVDFLSSEPVGYVMCPPNLAKNVPILFSWIDSKPDPCGNLYYVMKMDNRNSAEVELSVMWKYAILSLRSYPEDFQRNQSIPNTKKPELYSQGF